MREKEVKEKYPIGTKVKFSPGIDSNGVIEAIGLVDGYWQNETEGESDGDGYYTHISWAMTIKIEGQKHGYIRESHEVEIVS